MVYRICILLQVCIWCMILEVAAMTSYGYTMLTQQNLTMKVTQEVTWEKKYHIHNLYHDGW